MPRPLFPLSDGELRVVWLGSSRRLVSRWVLNSQIPFSVYYICLPLGALASHRVVAPEAEGPWLKLLSLHSLPAGRSSASPVTSLGPGWFI